MANLLLAELAKAAEATKKKIKLKKTMNKFSLYAGKS